MAAGGGAAEGGVRCEALALLHELRGSFSQLHSDLEQYRTHTTGIESQMEECRDVLRRLNIHVPAAEPASPPGRSAAPAGEPLCSLDLRGGSPSHLLSPGTMLERDVHRTLEETEVLLSKTGGLTGGAQPLLPTADSRRCEADESDARGSLQRAFSQQWSDLQEDMALLQWQHQHSSRATATTAPSQMSSSISEADATLPVLPTVVPRDPLDAEVERLLAEGVWKAKQDSRGHTYYYKASDKKTRVWNLKKHLKDQARP